MISAIITQAPLRSDLRRSAIAPDEGQGLQQLDADSDEEGEL